MSQNGDFKIVHLPAPAFEQAARRLLGIVPCVLACLALHAAPARAAAPGRPWLVFSDLHYSPFYHNGSPSPYGDDTNDALLGSFLAETRKVDPDPPVVVIAGDFLAHHFPLDSAASTMAALARRFDAAFPHAQFVIVLGNNDSACGDYAAPIDGAFLATTAKAWAPLVNRNGAAPDFASRFGHDGGYVARLPVPGLRVVVANDIFDSLRYDDSCAGGANGAAESIGRLRSDLRAAGPHDRNWVLMHIPPGIDAFTTTQFVHRLGIVPFLRPRAREAIDSALRDPAYRVVLAVAGHTHKFAYRIDGARVPLLLVPSVSPIFYNAPSFLTVTVGPDGTLANAAETSLVKGQWRSEGDLHALGVTRFTVAELDALQGKLERDAALRARFSRLYSGGGPPEITESNWRSYWCAATNVTATAFEKCSGQEGLSILTGRGVKVLVVLAALSLLAAVAFFFFFFRAKGRART